MLFLQYVVCPQIFRSLSFSNKNFYSSIDQTLLAPLEYIFMTDTLYSVFQNYREKINFPHQYKRETIIKGFFYASVWFYRGLNYYKSGNIAHSYGNPIIPTKKTSNRQNCWNEECSLHFLKHSKCCLKT
jgi:hypothetical protein